ncbi:MAG: S41 family peptidase, partial [Actinomycetota bacterium]|nr:S41 family peptidase [Actinomycetota bacterium]
MPPRRRQQAPALLAAALPLLLVAGIWLGGHPEDLPSFVRSAFVADHATRVVDEAIDRIASDYYRPVRKASLADASIAGAVAHLGDRFSHYLSPREFKEFNQPPSFTGIGVEVAPVLVKLGFGRAGLQIVRVFDSSPASRAGVRTGDVIVAVNRRELAGMSTNAATALIKGPPGTDVELAIQERRAGHTVTPTLKITRATISEPVVASAARVVHARRLGAVALAMFSPGAHGEVRQAVERQLRAGARGIVFDLRDNGGGLVEEARLIASIFIAKGTIVSTRGRTQPSEVLTATGDAIPP